MKAFLMHAGEDFDADRSLPPNQPDLVQDLELDILVEAMAGGDPLLFEVAKRALLLSLPDTHAISYRQQALGDCLSNQPLIRELYALAGEALAAEKRVFRWMSKDSPRSLLSRAVEVLELLSDSLKRLRGLADEHADEFSSPAFQRFFTMLSEELDDEYLALMDQRLQELHFHTGELISVQLGPGNQGIGYTLRREAPVQGWFKRLGFLDRSGYTFTIPERDQAGFRALGELEDRGLNLAADAVAQAGDHVTSFFTMLRIELGFYVGCVNLRNRLKELRAPTCFPAAASGDQDVLSASGLYDVCLALTVARPVVGNDLAGNGKSLVMITGANQGGKSTLLRAVGLAQLMTQAGMFAPAAALRTNLATGVFTHFKRQEDKTMRSGKLDEELRRMSQIVDQIAPRGLLLCNESFASTNEREGSEIARQVIAAMIDAGVKVVFVTHQFALAEGCHTARSPRSLFLRAARETSGKRTYKITEGEPLPTSYGEDSYGKVFGHELEDAHHPLAPNQAGGSINQEV